MKTRKNIEKTIIAQSTITNTNGYVSSNKDNLIDGVDEDLFHNDLSKGSGNELASKFNALYSSAALAVNNFAIVKKIVKTFVLIIINHFKKQNLNESFPPD